MLTFLALWIFSPSFAALPASQQATPFYRSSQSLFSSGQASRELLEENLSRSELEVNYAAEWNKKQYLLQGSSILRDIQVAKFVATLSSVQILSEKKSNALKLETLPQGASLTILDTDEYWAFVQNPKTKVTGYLPLHTLQARNEDTGYYINLIDTYLRKSNRNGGDIITTIPRMTRFEVLGIQNGWLEVSYKNHRGFVDINHFVSRADFATLAYNPKQQWFTVKYRENGTLLSSKGQHIPLSEVRGYITNSLRGVVAQNNLGDKLPPLRAQVKILQPKANIWGVSKLPDHGEVWWKKINLQNIAAEPSAANKASTEGITTDLLIKKRIYSISFAGKNSLKGLASAGGIYRTEDGLHWKLVSQFAEQNYPVSIHPDGAWFVGSYRSNDEGRTFEPFIRWDKLAQAIESSIHRSPRILRLTKIESLPRSKVQIQIDTGIRNVKLRSDLFSEHWEVIKN